MRSTSAQRLEQNARNFGSDGLPQIGQGARRGAAGSVMAVFPNPVSQQFSIQVHDQPAPGARLQWVDASGRLVAEEAFLAGGTRAVPDIADGLYLLRLVDTNGSPIGVSRLILQR